MPDILSYSANFCVAGEDYHVVKAQLNDFYPNEEFLKMCQLALSQKIETVGDIIKGLQNPSPADCARLGGTENARWVQAPAL